MSPHIPVPRLDHLNLPLPLLHLQAVADALPYLGGDGPEQVPAALWDHALIAPARHFLQEPGKGFRARLVALGWELAGGAPGQCPAELAVAIEWLHAGSLIVDDIQDQAQTRRGQPALHLSHGMPRALNTANWMYFAALQRLMAAGLPAGRAAELQRCAIDALAGCHCGQALDLAARVDQLPQGEVAGVVAATTSLKTGALMALAAELGARAAGGEAAQVAALAAFGHGLGCALQMLDDAGAVLTDQRRDKALEDLRGAHPTWVWAWLASDIDAFAWARLQGQLKAVVAGGCPEVLLAELRRLLAPTGQRRAAAQLEASFSQLRQRIGDHPRLSHVEAEIARLKVSYG